MGKTIESKMPPMAAIPTTAGTGSEATQFTIITDTKRDIKMLLKGKSMVDVLRPFNETVAKPFEVRHTSSELKQLADFNITVTCSLV